MVCIYCQQKLDVVNTRHKARTNDVWRRRKCPNCHTVFTTTESFDLPTTLRVKRSATHLEPFSRDELLVSIHESCKHRKDASKASGALTDTIIKQILPTVSDATVTRGDIVSTAKKVLARFDKAAASHYSAYHPID